MSITKELLILAQLSSRSTVFRSQLFFALAS